MLNGDRHLDNKSFLTNLCEKTVAALIEEQVKVWIVVCPVIMVMADE
jgi:hypothetical protein